MVPQRARAAMNPHERDALHAGDPRDGQRAVMAIALVMTMQTRR